MRGQSGVHSRKVPAGSVLVLAAIVLLAGDATVSSAGQKSRGAAVVSRRVRRSPLQNVDRLKEAFQRDAGKLRMVVLLSPT